MMVDESVWQCAIRQFNAQDFYDCHDTLEAMWVDAPLPDKPFYQGLLQVAVACHHLQNGNWRGAVMLLGEGTRRLHDYQPDYQAIDVTQVLESSLNLLNQLQQAGPEAAQTQTFDFPTVSWIQPTGELPKLSGHLGEISD